MKTLNQYINESVDANKIFEEEELILEVTEAVWQALEDTQLTKKDLANRIGCSTTDVTQFLNGSRNMTLRNLVRIAAALGRKVELRLSKTEADSKV